MPGYRGERVQCAQCGEGINYHRDVHRDGRTLCIPCAQGGLLANGNGVKGAPTQQKILLVVGSKKVGKTSLIEKLIPELSGRGYRVGTVKHHHSDFSVSVDSEGTDTWRHRQAGASSVVLVTPTHSALFRDSDSSLSLDQIVSSLGAMDIVLVEGFHDQPRAKIEVLADRNDEPLCKLDDHLLAFVAPNARQATVPIFAPSHIKSLADFIERELLTVT
jgi:molybdopterin-guanine dinucleotide biosynthesis protein B